VETDRYGLDLTTASSEAAAAYRDGVDLVLSAYPGAEKSFGSALQHDQGFALAHAGLARHHQIYSRVAEARASIARARALAPGASPREQAHVHILGLVIDGQPGKALEALLPHLEAFPRDALPLSLALGAFGLYGFSGRADHDAARLALCRKLAPAYGEDWWFLTHLGWSHTEAGKLGAGGRITERALQLRRENAHGAHAYAHFFAEADEGEDGAQFVEDWLVDYDSGGMLYAHINWHRALWCLEEQDVDGALEIYAGVLRPARNGAPPINVISDAASLLWRISLKAPVDWGEVHQYGKARFPGPAPHFIEWHLAMTAAGAGDFGELERRLSALPELPPGAVFGKVCAAFKAFARTDYAEVIALLEPVTAGFVRMGGSGAQRAVLDDTLNAARRRRGE
jgi:tetratricopeptide (TPR) repeat protein